MHSLRHTMLTPLGEAGGRCIHHYENADQSSATASQRYVHPTPEGMERAFERLQELNATNFEEAKAEAVAVGAEGSRLPAKVATVKKGNSSKSPQVVVIKRTGP